jgi:hypothetical protein
MGYVLVWAVHQCEMKFGGSPTSQAGILEPLTVVTEDLDARQ